MNSSDEAIADSRSGIAKGTVVYLLHPTGEGAWRVWYQGNDSVNPLATGTEDRLFAVSSPTDPVWGIFAFLE
jgi:hypothetical protein